LNPAPVAWASLARYRRSRNRPFAGRLTDPPSAKTPLPQLFSPQTIQTMTPIVIIPARMAASRLPGKPLADIGGTSMIVRVLRQAEEAGVGEVAVAAGDAEIVAVVQAVGGRAVMTDPRLPSGSDRVLAALEALDPDGRCDVVVNLQGDMPFVSPAVISACMGVLAAEADCDIATAIALEASVADRNDPAVVKAIVSLGEGDPRGRALYFTRSTLYGDGPIWKHVGIYAYRRAALVRFCAAPPSPLEQREKLEQLRALEMGLSIWAAVVDETPISVDTPADLEAARAFVKGRP
jgi:3-deoxy-manno-octulosonate cytidylyltransferase (CMP-KDO synthetase)